MLPLQRWYNLSDPGLEELSFLGFTGFSFESSIPDETTVCRFRNELLKKGLLARIDNQPEKKDILVKKGAIVDAARLKTVGYGESNPVADNETELGRARSRRVELVRE